MILSGHLVHYVEQHWKSQDEGRRQEHPIEFQHHF